MYGIDGHIVRQILQIRMWFSTATTEPSIARSSTTHTRIDSGQNHRCNGARIELFKTETEHYSQRCEAEQYFAAQTWVLIEESSIPFLFWRVFGFVVPGGDIKLCDFGISGQLVDSIARTKDAGCRPYMAVSEFLFLIEVRSLSVVTECEIFPKISRSE